MAFNNHQAKRHHADAEGYRRGQELGRRWARIFNVRARLLTQRLSHWQRANSRNRRLAAGLLITFFIFYITYLTITILSYYGTAAAPSP